MCQRTFFKFEESNSFLGVIKLFLISQTAREKLIRARSIEHSNAKLNDTMYVLSKRVFENSFCLYFSLLDQTWP
jgi:hypothetical protein